MILAARFPALWIATAVVCLASNTPASGRAQGGGLDDATMNAMVRIVADREGETVRGSGFIVAIDRERSIAIVVTSAHVIEGTKFEAILKVDPSQTPLPTDVIGLETENRNGLAVFRVRNIPAAATTLEIAPASQRAPRPAQSLTLVGYPNTATSLRAVSRSFVGREGGMYLIDGSVGEGSSGGPLLLDGKVVGLVSSTSGDVTYAVSFPVIRAYLDGSDVQLTDAADGPKTDRSTPRAAPGPPPAPAPAPAEPPALAEAPLTGPLPGSLVDPPIVPTAPPAPDAAATPPSTPGSSPSTAPAGKPPATGAAASPPGATGAKPSDARGASTPPAPAVDPATSAAPPGTSAANPASGAPAAAASGSGNTPATSSNSQPAGAADVPEPPKHSDAALEAARHARTAIVKITGTIDGKKVEASGFVVMIRRAARDTYIATSGRFFFASDLMVTFADDREHPRPARYGGQTKEQKGEVTADNIFLLRVEGEIPEETTILEISGSGPPAQLPVQLVASGDAGQPHVVERRCLGPEAGTPYLLAFDGGIAAEFLGGPVLVDGRVAGVIVKISESRALAYAGQYIRSVLALIKPELAASR